MDSCTKLLLNLHIQLSWDFMSQKLIILTVSTMGRNYIYFDRKHCRCSAFPQSNDIHRFLKINQLLAYSSYETCRLLSYMSYLKTTFIICVKILQNDLCERWPIIFKYSDGCLFSVWLSNRFFGFHIINVAKRTDMRDKLSLLGIQIKLMASLFISSCHLLH